MWMQRWIACGLGAAGLMCLAASLESSGLATECTPSGVYSPYKCRPAHEEPNPNRLEGLVCAAFGSSCNAPEGSTCGSSLGWGIVRPGMCELQQDIGYKVYSCVQDYALTVVTLHQWKSECRVIDGTCTCHLLPDDMGGSHNVEICDCNQTLIAQ